MEVEISGKKYHFSCIESAYQAHKCLKRINEFTSLNGFEAKKLGKTVELRSDWNDIKVDVMRKLLKQKFMDKELLTKLQLIKGEIVENNYWGDTFWGKCYGKGENTLGKILMDIRDNNI